MDTSLIPTPGMGHNMLAASRHLDALEDARSLASVVDAWQAQVGEIARSDDAEHARDLLARLTSAARSAESERVAEKEPHLAAGRAVDAQWKPVLELLAAAKKPIEALLSAWLKRERERLAAEAAAAREAAAKAEAEARAKLEAAAGIEQATVAAAQVEAARAATADAARLAKARPQVVSATGGARAASLRMTYRARCTDVLKAVRRYKGRPELIECLERLASADARAAKGQIEIPGFEVIAEERVA